MPVCSRKNLVITEFDWKFVRDATSFISRSESRRRAFISRMEYSIIQSFAERPLISVITIVRCLADTHIFCAKKRNIPAYGMKFDHQTKEVE